MFQVATLFPQEQMVPLLPYGSAVRRPQKLRRLAAVELKVGNFEIAYTSQMEMYLRWLDRFERESGEEPPLGIILCTGKKREQIELLELDKSGIHVAEYLTALPPREVLTERLQQATARARQTLDQRLPPSASAAADTPDPMTTDRRGGLARLRRRTPSPDSSTPADRAPA